MLNDTTVSGYKPECWTVGSLTAGAAATYIPYVVNTTRADVLADPASEELLDFFAHCDGVCVLVVDAVITHAEAVQQIVATDFLAEPVVVRLDGLSGAHGLISVQYKHVRQFPLVSSSSRRPHLFGKKRPRIL